MKLKRLLSTVFLGVLLPCTSLFAQLDHFDFNTVSDAVAGDSITITITAKDTAGQTVTIFTSSCDLTDLSGSIAPATTGNFTAGVWTGKVVFTNSYQNNTITADYLGLVQGTSNTFNVSAAAVDHFVFGTIGSNQTAGTSFPVTIQAFDTYNNFVDNFAQTVSLSDETGSMSPTSAGFSGGQWTGSVTILQATNADSITATYGGATGTSNAFAVDDAGVDHFVFNTILSPQTAGTSFSVTIQAYDVYDNLDNEFSQSVNLTDETGSMSPTNADFSGGQWTGSVTITQATNADSITATYGGATGTSNAFAVDDAGLDHFVFSTIGPTQMAGVPFSVTIQAYDVYNNLADGFSNPVSLSDVTGTLTPTTVSFSGGGWTGNLTVTQAVGVDSVIADYSGTTGSSNNFFVDNASLHHFTISPISSPQTAGDPFTVAIAARDTFENRVDDFNQTVTLSDLTGNMSPTNATFTSGLWSNAVTISQSIDSDQITASYNSVTGASNTFQVVSGPLDTFVFDTISDQTAGLPFPITITAKDVYGNTVESFTNTVTLSDLSGSIQPTTSGNFTNGVWTGQVTVSALYTNDRITASGSNRSGQSNFFNVVAAAVNHFEFDTISGNKTAGVDFPITIYAKDAFDNTVDTYTGIADLSDITGSINPTQTENFQSGVWTGTVSITQSYLNDRITATDGGVTGQSNQFTVLAAGLERFDIDPVSNQTAGVNFQITITAYDQYNNVVLAFAETVSITDSSGTIYPTTSGNFENGVRNQIVHVNQARNDDVIRVSAQGKTGDSNPFNISPGGLDHFDFEEILDQVAGGAFSITIRAYDGYNNLKTNFSNKAALSDRTGTLQPDSTDIFTNGIWQGWVVVNQSFANDRITAEYNDKQGNSNNFDIFPASLDHFEFATIQNHRTAGVPFPVSVTALDSLDNIVITFNEDVELYDLSESYHDTVAMTAGQWDGNVTVTRTREDDRMKAEYLGIISLSNPFDVDPNDPEFLVLQPPDPFNITVGTTQVFTGTVTDTFLNPVPETNISFFLKSPRRGTLSDNPDEPVYNTTGNDQVQTGITDPNGVLTVLYSAPQVSGLADTLDAMSTPDIPQDRVADVSITTVDSGATKLAIKPMDPTQIREAAGDIFTFIVEAQDGFGNIDDDDTTMVQLTSGYGDMEFSSDGSFSDTLEFRLSAGTDTLQARSCTAADNDTISVSDIDGEGIILAPYRKSQVYIEPDLPSGIVALQASRDTLTADGSSTTQILTESFIDSCGNIVAENTSITVAATIGTIIDQDQDLGTPGKQLQTDQEGKIQLTLKATSASGTSTVSVVSVQGDASGSIDIVFQSQAILAYLSGSLVPNTVSPGDSVSFKVLVKNEGEAGVTVNTGSEFWFADPPIEYRAGLVEDIDLDGGSDWDTLTFAVEMIPEGMEITSYTPILDLTGTDYNSSPYDQDVALDNNSLQISSMKIVLVQAARDTVTVEDSLGVIITVENSGSQSIIIDDYGLIFAPPGDFAQFITVPDTLPPLVTSYLPVGVKVNSLTGTGTYYIDAFAAGSSGGSEIGDNSSDLIDSLVVISLATAEYVAGSLSPENLSPGGQYAMSLHVQNNGESSVNLNTTNTKVSFFDAEHTYEGHLANETTLTGGGAETQLTFSLETLDPGFSSGLYPVDLFLSGQTHAGGSFNQVLPDVDSVAVQSEPELQYVPGSMSKEKVSRGYMVHISARVSNTGEATLDLTDGSTRFYMTDGQEEFDIALNESGTAVLEPGDTTLTFLQGQLDSDFDTGEFPTLMFVQGVYNQINFVDTLNLDPLLVQEPATISVNAQRSDTVVTIGQSFIVESIVENMGEAGIMDTGSILLDLAGTAFSVSDPERPFDPALPDTIQWTVTVPDTQSVGIYIIKVSVEAIPHDENTDPAQLALLYNQGEYSIPVSVVEGNELVVTAVELDGFPTRNVYAGQGAVGMIALELSNRGNAKNEIRLDSIKVSLEERSGDVINPPSSVIEDLYVSSDIEGEALLSSAFDLSRETVLVNLREADFRLSANPDTLYFFLDIIPSPGAQTILLHFNGNEDIFATDLSNGRIVNIVDALGTDLPELLSDFVVLSADDFTGSFKNYPNPFRAGFEPTTIAYYLPENARVELFIYSLTGELVKILRFDQGTPGGSGPGINTYQWDGRNGRGEVILNGVYLCVVSARLESGRTLSHQHKIAVMK